MVEQIRQGDIPGVQLRCRQTLNAAPEEIWPWLTETDRQALWLAERAELDRETGQVWLIETTGGHEAPRRERFETVEADLPHKWVVDLQDLDGNWPSPTRITFELTETPSGTELSVLQTGFAHLPLSDCLTIWESYRRRWRTALTALAELL